MRLIEAIRSALGAIMTNTLRSLLTMLGIVIGVAAVIAMVAIGAGARNLVDTQIRSLGANLAIVTPGNVTQGGARLGAGAASSLTDDDADAIRREVEGVAAAAPFIQGLTQVVAGGSNWATRIYGIDLDWFDAREWDVANGRSFDAEEIRRGDIVIILGETVARNLFGEEDPIDRTVRVRNVPFRVIGVMAPKGQSAFGQDQDDVIFVPLDAGRRRVIGRNYARDGSVGSIFVKFDREEDIEPGIALMTDLLRQRHRITGDQEDDFAIRNLTEIANTATASANTLVPAASRGRGGFAAGRRHRHHEHHAGLGHGTDPRDRLAPRRRREAAGYSEPVPDRSYHAFDHRRLDRCRARDHRGLRRSQPRGMALARIAERGRSRCRVLGDGRHLLRPVSRAAGRAPRSDRGTAARLVIRPR